MGKLDATADRKTGVLSVNGLHWDIEPNKTASAALEAEVDDLAGWLGLCPRDALQIESAAGTRMAAWSIRS